MTKVYFVRHAEPIHSWHDDRTRPLSEAGELDCNKITEYLSTIPVDVFISSPYKRSFDTIAESAIQFGKQITTDERLREREQGEGYKNIDMIRKRWADFDYCEPGGETINSTQKRNIEALSEVLVEYEDKNIVIGTHGSALATIINHYDKSFHIESMLRIIDYMPYIIRLDFNGSKYSGREELLTVDRPYKV